MPTSLPPRFGALEIEPALGRPDLLAAPVHQFLSTWSRADEVGVAEIDPNLADTAAFCERYDVGLDVSANCVVIAARRGDVVRMAACMVLATMRADVNGVVRRMLDTRKASFAAMDDAVAATAMEYGGITPLGLPSDWPIFVAAEAAKPPLVVIGSGVRRSKLLLPGSALLDVPAAEAVDGLARVRG
jgi:prolyl-tRNA editing enzyme YbaK/EbsC (Cys-tRNA(Pro) deacylase)